MKMLRILLSTVLVGAFLCTSGYAITASSHNRKTDLPHPVKIVSPVEVPPCCIDTAIKVAFTLDENGRPFDIEIIRPHNRMLRKSLLVAIEQWRFTPFLKDGIPVRQRCLLPLVVTYKES